MQAFWELAIVNILMGMGGALAVGRWRPAARPAERFVAGWLAGAALLIALTYAASGLGYASRLVPWSLWLAIWGLCLLRRPRDSAPSGKPALRSVRKWREWAGLGLALGLGAVVLLRDPWSHVAPASIDSCRFAVFLSAFLHRSEVFADYLIGIPVWIGQTRLFHHDVLELMCWGPPLLGLLAIPAAFAFYSRIFHRRVGWLSAVALAGSAGIVAIPAYSLIFVQFAALVPALPALLVYLPRALRPGCRAEWMLASAALLLLAFAGTYFALLVATGFGAWLVLNLGLGKIGRGAFLRGLLLLAIVPAWILFYYGVAVPRAQSREPARSFSVQVDAFIRSPAVHTDASSVESSVLRGFQVFASPKRLHLVRASRVQTLLFWLLAALAIPLLKRPASSRGLLGFLLLFSAFATITGMFDMPGYQGRHLYLMLLLGVPAASFFAVFRLIPLAIRLAARAGLSLRPAVAFRMGLGVVLLSCIPSVRHPPEIGGNVPVSPDLVVRRIPEDDWLVGLARTIPEDEPQTLVFVSLGPAAPLPGEHLRILNRVQGFSGLRFRRVLPAQLLRPRFSRKAPPRFAVLAPADWNSLGSSPVREWHHLCFGPPLFETGRMVCVPFTTVKRGI